MYARLEREGLEAECHCHLVATQWIVRAMGVVNVEDESEVHCSKSAAK